MFEVFKALDISSFRLVELAFIKEYCTVMQPLAYALDILHAERKCFMGFLLPILAALQTKLTALQPELKLTHPLVDAILTGIKTHFVGYGNRSKLILASVSLPQFKLRWIDDEANR